MRGRGFTIRCPVIPAPVYGVIGRITIHAFPPNVTVIGQGYVGEDAVLLDGFHRARVGFVGGAGRNAEVTGFRIDGIQVAIITRLDPGNIITDRRDLPALLLVMFGRNDHREIGFAACTGESGGDVSLFTAWFLNTHDEHVFGQPSLVAGHGGSNAQSQALLAEQGVAAVTTAI